MRRKISSLVKGSQFVNDKNISGFGYAIVPNDLDREEYIKSVHITGYCMVVTQFNEILRDVTVPIDLIQELSFPFESGKYGSLVNWSKNESGQYIIGSIHRKPNEGVYYGQDTWTDIREVYGSTMSDIKSLSAGIWQISFDNKAGNNGWIEIKSNSPTNKSVIKIKADGTIEMLANNVDNKIAGGIKTIVGVKKENQSVLQLDEEGGVTYKDRYDNEILIIDGQVSIKSSKVSIISDSINLGQEDSDQSAVLGDKLKTELLSHTRFITALKNAISAAPVAPTDGGASFKASLVSAIASFEPSQFQNILSSKNKLD